MVSEGRFPFPGGQVDSDSSPRAGDGLVRLDADGRVSYASPNAVSGYRRLGWTGDLVGADFGAMTAGLAPHRRAGRGVDRLAGRRRVRPRIERGNRGPRASR